MKFKTDSKSRAPALALTSMLDVIFLLLCFFVTVSVFSQWESEISIKLPAARTSEQLERLPGEIIINLSKEGTVKVNGSILPLPGQPVIIRADREVRYESLVSVIDTCREADVWNFSLATEGDSAK